MPRRTQPSRASGSAMAAWRRGDVPQRRGETDGCAAPPRPPRTARRRGAIVLAEVLERWLKIPITRSLPMRSSRAASAKIDGAVLGRDAVAAEPGLELEVHTHWAIDGCRGRRLQQLVEARDARARSRATAASRKSGSGGVQPREDRRVDAGPAQRERLADVGDAEPRRAALECRDRGAHGAVAVAVGLDDGDDLGAGQPAQMPHVRGDRADVDGRLAQHSGGPRRLTRRPPAGARGRVGSAGPAPPSTTTYAIAKPASCDIERCSVVPPLAGDDAAVAPVRREPRACREARR